MTATYNVNLSADKDKVRLYIGDTDTSNAMFSDEEITAVLTLEPSVLYAAATMADNAAGKYSRSVSFGVEGLSIQNVQKSDNFRKLASRLRARAKNDGNIGSPSVMGISEAEKQSVNDDIDRTVSDFRVGMDDNPRGGTFGSRR